MPKIGLSSNMSRESVGVNCWGKDEEGTLMLLLRLGSFFLRYNVTIALQVLQDTRDTNKTLREVVRDQGRWGRVA